MTFKESLRRWIAFKNISRKDLEIKAGLNPRALEPYLDRNTDPTIGVAKKLADALGVSLDKLYDFDYVEGTISNELFELIELIQDFDADDVYTVSSMIKLIHGKEKYRKLQKKEQDPKNTTELVNIGDERVVGKSPIRKINKIGGNDDNKHIFENIK